MSATIRELRDLCDAALTGDRDERWDAMMHGGPLEPERIDVWEISSAPSGEPICQLSSYGKWPNGGIERVAVLARFVAAANPARVRELIREVDRPASRPVEGENERLRARLAQLEPVWIAARALQQSLTETAGDFTSGVALKQDLLWLAIDAAREPSK